MTPSPRTCKHGCIGVLSLPSHANIRRADPLGRWCKGVNSIHSPLQSLVEMEQHKDDSTRLHDKSLSVLVGPSLDELCLHEATVIVQATCAVPQLTCVEGLRTPIFFTSSRKPAPLSAEDRLRGRSAFLRTVCDIFERTSTLLQDNHRSMALHSWAVVVDRRRRRMRFPLPNLPICGDASCTGSLLPVVGPSSIA